MEEEKKEELTEEMKQEEDTSVDNEMKQELEDTMDRLKRLMAEFDNYKKRSAKEREMLYHSLVGDIASSLLPVLDNLEKAVGAETTDEAYKQGIELVLKQFVDVLTSLGIEEVPTIGTTFNPELHEAVSSVEDDTLGEKEVKEVLRKGYQIKGKVIRHAMVVVAN